jgi:shikimate dehydrogenase
VSIPQGGRIAHLDAVDDTARHQRRQHRHAARRLLVGTNTDWIGAVRRSSARRPPASARCSEGRHRAAAVFGLRERGARVAVLNRSAERARALARELGADAAGELGELARTPYEVLVNTTPVGLRSDASPVAADALREGSVVLDAVYDPERTRLLRDAEARGARVVAGKWMLVHQAAAQLETWTGLEPPLDLMAAAFDAAGPQARSARSEP